MISFNEVPKLYSYLQIILTVLSLNKLANSDRNSTPQPKSHVENYFIICKTPSSLIILAMSLIKLWLDISNLLSTKKKPGAKAPGFFVDGAKKACFLKGQKQKNRCHAIAWLAFSLLSISLRITSEAILSLFNPLRG